MENVTFKELQATAKDLNTILDCDPAIKFVGVKKEVIIEGIAEAMALVEDGDKLSKVTEKVIAAIKGAGGGGEFEASGPALTDVGKEPCPDKGTGFDSEKAECEKCDDRKQCRKDSKIAAKVILQKGKTEESSMEVSESELILPDKINAMELDFANWEYSVAIQKCQNLFREVREGGLDLVLEFLKAHEMLVNKKVEGETWGGFCDTVGITTHTVVNWFRKYSLPFTKVSGPERITDKNANDVSDNTSGEASDNMGSEDNSNADWETKKSSEKGSETKKVSAKSRRIAKLFYTVLTCADELEYLVSEVDAIDAGDKKVVRSILKKGTGIILSLHKLGVDVKKVYDTVIEPKN